MFEALELQRATTITELVAVVGCSRSSISGAVDTLSAYRLLDRSPEGLIAYPDKLARVAEDFGVSGAIALLLNTYAKHRRIWHAWLARHNLAITERDLYDPRVRRVLAPTATTRAGPRRHSCLLGSTRMGRPRW